MWTAGFKPSSAAASELTFEGIALTPELNLGRCKETFLTPSAGYASWILPCWFPLTYSAAKFQTEGSSLKGSWSLLKSLPKTQLVPLTNHLIPLLIFPFGSNLN